VEAVPSTVRPPSRVLAQGWSRAPAPRGAGALRFGGQRSGACASRRVLHGERHVPATSHSTRSRASRSTTAAPALARLAKRLRLAKAGTSRNAPSARDVLENSLAAPVVGPEARFGRSAPDSDPLRERRRPSPRPARPRPFGLAMD